jgi:hypothetical protein
VKIDPGRHTCSNLTLLNARCAYARRGPISKRNEYIRKFRRREHQKNRSPPGSGCVSFHHNPIYPVPTPHAFANSNSHSLVSSTSAHSSQYPSITAHSSHKKHHSSFFPQETSQLILPTRNITLRLLIGPRRAYAQRALSRVRLCSILIHIEKHFHTCRSR